MKKWRTDIRASRRQIRVLRADEARLGRLIEGIGRVIARVEATPEPGSAKEAFSALRGRLRLPVRLCPYQTTSAATATHSFVAGDSDLRSPGVTPSS